MPNTDHGQAEAGVHRDVQLSSASAAEWLPSHDGLLCCSSTCPLHNKLQVCQTAKCETALMVQ